MASNLSLMDTLRLLVVETVDAQKPCDIVYGTVKSLSPFEVIVDKMTLDADFLQALARCSDQELGVGDTVALLRLQGGQEYLLLDKVVSV